MPDSSATSAIPRPVIGLGAAGYLPFMALSIYALVPGSANSGLALSMLQGYGAVILSFLGGIHWGRAIANEQARWPVMTLGVIPSLIGSAALALPFGSGAIVLVVGFIFALAHDLVATRNRDMPKWYPRLRVPLTLAVCLTLLIPVLF